MRWLVALLVTIGWLAAAPAAPAATLSMSTFFGGSNHDQIADVATDPAGNVYVAGWSMSPDLPLRNARFGFTGGNPDYCHDEVCPDAFVAKFSPGGSLIYSTYLAGSRLDEATAIAVDDAGNAYVAGRTASGDFPAGGNPDPLSGGSRVFVVKLTPDGSALDWTRFVGPTYQLNEADIAVDDAGRVYVAGTTEHEDFVTTPGAHDRQCVDPRYNDNCTDAFVARFTTGGALVATTMLGGDFPDEQAYAVAIDSAGRPVVAGWVGAPMYGFPKTPGTYGSTPETSGRAAFVARFSADLSQLEWATAYGGRDNDLIFGLALDAEDRPIVVGSTDSRDYPTTPGALDRQCNASDEWESCPGQPDGFATKMTADGTDLVWSTYVGGTGEDAAYSVALGPDGSVSLTGTTSTENRFPLMGAYQDDLRFSDASCDNRWYCEDSFLVRLSGSGALLYGSLLGGGSQDAGRGVAVDPGGNAWLGGVAYSSDFPVTSGRRAGGECPGWEYYDNPECSDGFLAAFGSLPASPQQPATSVEGATGSQSPARGTEVRRLTVARHGRIVSGRLTGCTGRARLMLERRAPARWRVVRRLRTRADGRYAVRLPARAGRYRLSAPCASLRSRVISLR